MTIKQTTSKINSKVSREIKQGVFYGTFIGSMSGIKLIAAKVSGRLDELETPMSYGDVAKTAAILTVGAAATGAVIGGTLTGIKKVYKLCTEKKDSKTEQAPA